MNDKEKNEIIPYERYDYYQKSNMLIGAKYKSSLLENKLMAISLSMVNNGVYKEEDGKLAVEFPAAFLRKKLNMNAGSFYKTLDVTAKNMTGRTIGYSDPESQRFKYMAVVTDSIYENGNFKIMFNSSLKPYIQKLDKNFTMLNLTAMLDFESVYGFRLYELLKSKAYHPKGVTGRKVFSLDFGLAELKLDLGVINANSERVKSHLNDKVAPDYEKISEIAQEQQFKRWTDFKKNVLDVAVEEINLISKDMTVSYSYLKGGKGAKVLSVNFIVDMEKKAQKEETESITAEELSNEEKDDIIDIISDMIEEPLKTKDIRAIAQAADYNIEKVKKAYIIAKESGGEKTSLVGFLIAAIKNEYEIPTTVKGKSVNKFNDYPQREYSKNDFDMLEQALLNKVIEDVAGTIEE